MNKKITDYNIIKSREISHLIRLVKAEMEDGWSPLGGVSEDTTGANYGQVHHHSCAQAMVKYEEDNQ